MPGLFEQVVYLLVACLRKVLVPEANGEELLRPVNTHQLVYFRCKLLTRCGCSNRDSNDNAGRVLVSNCANCCTHGSPARDPIIDKDDDTIVYVIGWAIP